MGESQQRPFRQPYASNAGPFNPFVSKDGLAKGLAVRARHQRQRQQFVLSVAGRRYQYSAQQLSESLQRLFSVYDGPTYQDSNAYINIHPTYLTQDGTAKGAVIDTKAGNVNQAI